MESVAFGCIAAVGFGFAVGLLTTAAVGLCVGVGVLGTLGAICSCLE